VWLLALRPGHAAHGTAPVQALVADRRIRCCLLRLRPSYANKHAQTRRLKTSRLSIDALHSAALDSRSTPRKRWALLCRETPNLDPSAAAECCFARKRAAGESVRSPRCGRAWLDTRAVEAYDVDMSVDTMDAPRARNVLIVANRTAATPALLAEVGRRASEGVCRFTLLVPRPYWDADTEESAITLELAIPLLEDAAGGRVEGLVGSEDPFLAASAALEAGSYDEVIISTLPARVSHWLHLDLPARLQRLGLPVTVVTAKKADRPLARARGDDRPDL
jgi:hypothetical protein